MWHILNYVPPLGSRRSALPGIISSFNSALERPVELFAPTFISLESKEGHVHKTEKPLLYHYIFVRGNEADVKQLCLTRQGFSYVIDRSGDTRRHLTVDDDTMSRFMLIAEYYGNRLPCFPLEEINLEEGDKVQIVSGPCAGLSGTYISRKGAKTGNVLIAIDGAMAAVVYDVKADYVRVLEFARDTRRVYDQLDSFTIRLLSSPEAYSSVHSPLVPAATVFSRRLGIVSLHNPKVDARLQALLYAAYEILGDTPSAALARAKYEALESHITNPWTRALCQWLLGDPDAARAALPESPAPKSRLQSLLLNLLSAI